MPSLKFETNQENRYFSFDPNEYFIFPQYKETTLPSKILYGMNVFNSMSDD